MNARTQSPVDRPKAAAKLSESNRRGLLVAVLGPDGSGKSTLITQLLGGAFADVVPAPTYRFHWCPNVTFGAVQRDDGPVVTDPHAQGDRGRFMSVVKLMFLIAKFNLGYWLSPVRTCIHRGGLVVGDRFFHDMLVDPRRYRMGAPRWLVRWAGHLIPAPDLFLVLDVRPEVARARKDEVSEEEGARQFAAYRAFAAETRSAQLIDANGPPEVVAAACARAIDAAWSAA